MFDYQLQNSLLYLQLLFINKDILIIFVDSPPSFLKEEICVCIESVVRFFIRRLIFSKIEPLFEIVGLVQSFLYDLNDLLVLYAFGFIVNYFNDFLNLEGSCLFPSRFLTIDVCFTLNFNKRLWLLNFESQSFLLCFYRAGTAIMLEPIWTIILNGLLFVENSQERDIFQKI